ncbi:Transcriptional repressor of the fructose operon, DeoR family [Mesoplasma florum W37]|uniref:Transcriptional repressor of the fructose operon, DeoR family n=1 Tax=Mesoplasma florum TaxID=2151 RepID=A0AAD0MN80_MESFO|nr:DeoR/GlpR family DNA-binding transcription regulator [Mesoplasma florum]AGY41252.1 Transcriptional repressor of the fructose operon, DeoR family [Mesoplasma florum W37]AVN59479.1 DeoR/GlpR transcriptional regulator [Mesoplasma florum]AVN65590.1 Transcriptional repressor of the fructose operon, DeoR family [Mesoplasma florum]
MIKKQRQSIILNFLKGKKIVAIETLSNELKIPLTTLRRDLAELEELKKIVKLHGGVEYKEPAFIYEDFFEKKIKDNVKEKETIAKEAIKKIKKNDSIFIDSGSNGYFVAKNLKADLNLQIVTNSIYNILELVKNGHDNVYLLGGKFTNVTGAILGFEALEALKNYNFDIAFLGVNAVDENGNIYTTSPEHAQVKIEVIKNSRESYGLADSSKLDRKSFYKFADKELIKLI